MAGQLQAGTSAVALPLELGEPMMGYGTRTGAAAALHDPLQARALYLRGATSDCLIVALEVCLIAPAQADLVRAQLERSTGVARERVLVGCIHTHSGPDTGIAALAAGEPVPPRAAALLEAAARAGEAAVRGAEPARLALAHAEARIGANRRLAEGPLDPDVLVLRVDDARGRPRAVVYVHGCHPTALGPENLAFSADWPWAAGARIAEALPAANPIFLLGAHADVDPRTRGVKDLAESGRTRGVGFEEVEELGREIGGAVAEAALGAEPLPAGAAAAVGAASGRVRLAAHRESEAERARALAALDLPPDAELGTDAFFRLETERTQGLPAAERRERIARVRSYLRGRMAPRFAGGAEADVEVQALRLGPARLAALPLEATVDVGLDWKARAGSPHAALLSIANGWLRYLPHPANFAEPGAHAHYEVLMSTFEAGAAKRLLDEAERLDARLAAELGA
jgi:hypothetical protein